MTKYVDVYLLPIAEENVSAYRQLAEGAGRIFRQHGALTYREYVASDLKVPDGVLAFPQAIELRPGETLVYAAVEFESEEHRNQVMERIFADEEMEQIMPKEPIFDVRRMLYGGFSILAEA